MGTVVRIQVHAWDWTNRPDINIMAAALSDVYVQGSKPCLINLDTGGDTYAVIFCSRQIDQSIAQRIYDEHFSNNVFGWEGKTLELNID